MDAKERITRILERWFIGEPALFSVLCTHELKAEVHMSCAVRTGKRRVEYNPAFIDEMSDLGLEEALRAEAIRILLKHPYERKPDACSMQAVSLGSNIVIGDNYRNEKLRIERPKDFGLKSGQAYEWYSRRIQELLPGSDGQDGRNGNEADGNSAMEALKEKATANAERNTDLSALWEEDELTAAMIDGIIERTKNWGSVGGAFAEKLIASTKAKINWRNVFAGFRASIITSERRLTRMRPSRRFGFDQMGSVREYTTRLLVAVDVSGSITSCNLSYFYGVINSSFRSGITEIDVIDFDCGVRQVRSLKKKMKEVKALGRGGTSFNEPIMYAHMNRYDGLVILTDGYAPEPIIPQGMRCEIMWVCQDQESYRDNEHWMRKSGRVCVMELS